MEIMTKLISFKTTEQQVDELNKLAKENLMSVSSIIRTAIQEYLAKERIRRTALIKAHKEIIRNE